MRKGFTIKTPRCGADHPPELATDCPPFLAEARASIIKARKANDLLVGMWRKTIRSTEAVRSEMEYYFADRKRRDFSDKTMVIQIRYHAMCMKRLVAIIRAAQEGLTSALNLKQAIDDQSIGADAGNSVTNTFEAQMDPRWELRVEKIARLAIERARAIENGSNDFEHRLDRQSALVGDPAPSIPKDQTRPAAMESAEEIIDLYINLIDNLNGMQSLFEGIWGERIFLEGRSEVANFARFREFASTSKRFLLTLRSVQDGILSAIFLTKSCLEQTGALRNEWMTAEQDEALKFEWVKRLVQMALEKWEIYGITLPKGWLEIMGEP